MKATQKITKAMQMVAAAKLRRAQLAAEAARPYAVRMESVLGNIAGSISSGPDVPLLLTGTGKDQTHLLVVLTAERGLCGAFNSSITRLARDRAVALMNQANGQDLLRRPQGQRGAAPPFGKQIVEVVELRSNKGVTFADAQAIAEKISDMFAAASSTSRPSSSAVSSRSSRRCRPVQQLIPATFPKSRRRRAGRPRPMITSPTGGDPCRPAAAQLAVQIIKALLENGAFRTGRPHERDGQRDPQRG